MHRILLVGNHVFQRDVIRYALADFPVEVSCADSLGEMFDDCRRSLFDLVILLDASWFNCGCDLIRKIRPDGLQHPEVYVIAWQQAEQTVLSLLECGVDQYMTFPLSLPRLRAKVNGAIRRGQ